MQPKPFMPSGKKVHWTFQKLTRHQRYPATLFSVESLWFWAVTALVAVTFVVVFSVESSPLLYVRYVLGGVFVLFLPGLMLISALYPRGEEIDGLKGLHYPSG
jgi:uncharacterized membrane protein